MATPQSEQFTEAQTPYRTPSSDVSSRSAVSLVRELFGEGAALMRAELALVRHETRENVDKAQRAVGAMAAGGVVLHAGVLALVACAILALDRIWPAWLAALVVGAIVCAIGATMLAVGKRKMKAESLMPGRAIHSMKDTTKFMRDETARATEKWQ